MAARPEPLGPINIKGLIGRLRAIIKDLTQVAFNNVLIKKRRNKYL